MRSSGNVLIPLEVVGDKQTPGLWFGLIIEDRNCANMARDKLNQVHRNGFQTLRLERMKGADITISILTYQRILLLCERKQYADQFCPPWNSLQVVAIFNL